nr:hypothetical protein [Tanacetum cinerariifolium]
CTSPSSISSFVVKPRGYFKLSAEAKFMPRRKFNVLAKNLEDIMMESLQISSQVNDVIANHIPSQVVTTPCRPSAVRPRDQDDPHPEGENKANTSEHGTFEIEGSSSGQVYESEPSPSMSCNQEQSNEFDFWTNSYAIDDDVIPNERVLQELVDEISQIVNEAKLIVARRVNGSILSITEPEYKNFNKNDIEDMYMLIVNHKVDDYAETGLLWSLSVFIKSTMIWERVYEF